MSKPKHITPLRRLALPAEDDFGFSDSELPAEVDGDQYQRDALAEHQSMQMPEGDYL